TKGKSFHGNRITVLCLLRKKKMEESVRPCRNGVAKGGVQPRRGKFRYLPVGPNHVAAFPVNAIGPARERRLCLVSAVGAERAADPGGKPADVVASAKERLRIIEERMRRESVADGVILIGQVHETAVARGAEIASGVPSDAGVAGTKQNLRRAQLVRYPGE